MEQGMMVLPQAADINCKLEVKYEFANLGAQTMEIDLSSVTFVENEQYSINLAFTGTAISFEIKVLPFEDIVEIP